jgi:inhibitor of cysteine peptidase
MGYPKNIHLLLLIPLAFAILAVACGDDDDTSDYPAEVQVTESDANSTVQLALDGELIVALASNPTTGFSWSVGEDSDENLVVQGEPTFVPAGSTTPVVGAGGTEVFTFRAESTGTARLVLEYKRQFEPSVKPEQTFSLTVEIR